MKLLTIFVLFSLFYFAYARYSRIKTVYVCEGKTLKLSCKYNQGIKVLYATYGRKNSTICTEDLEEEEDSQVEMNLDCRSHNATSILRQKCFLKTSCSVEINNDVFGDSCPEVSSNKKRTSS
ncbi:Calcium-independent receptor for alpha-latrotoxin [Carabus blaptoides fortunei]